MDQKAYLQYLRLHLSNLQSNSTEQSPGEVNPRCLSVPKILGENLTTFHVMIQTVSTASDLQVAQYLVSTLRSKEFLQQC